ncbi:SFRS7 [Acanthosepion pharaonis]|uniref:SFRS7 n=1 Tax=Acanthosepion pharaonis TaxID=158019 RepID=A0A812BHP2_ACAPH|nr:SFRS7 [Sepia pharaonis]
MINRAVLDRIRGGYRIFVGDLGNRVGKYELEREFKSFGPITDVWVARNPPGFAFLVFKYPEDAERAVRDLDGRMVCGRRVRVEHARPYQTRRPRGNPRRRGPVPPGGSWRRDQSYSRASSLCYGAPPTPSHVSSAHFSRSLKATNPKLLSYQHVENQPNAAVRSSSDRYSRSRSRERSYSRSYSRSRSPEKIPRSRGGHSSLDIPKRERYHDRSESHSMSPPILRQRLLRDMDGIEGSGRHYSPRSRSITPDDDRKYSSRSRNDVVDDDRDDQSEISERSLPPRKEKLNIKNSHSRSSSYDGSDLETGEISDHPISKSHNMKLNRSPSPDRCHQMMPLSHSQGSGMYNRSDSDDDK